MTNDAPDTKRPRRRRWHAAAIVVAVLTFGGGVFLNLPGDLIFDSAVFLDSEFSSFPCLVREVSFGWPFHFARHLGWRPRGNVPHVPWGPNPFDDGLEWTWWKLSANIIIVMAGSLMLGWLTQRHITKYNFRFGLSHIAVLLLAIGCVLGYGTYRYRLQQAQLDITFPSGDTEEAAYLEWAPFGPFWLRSLTGDKFWRWGDRLLAAEPHGFQEIETFPGKSTILVLRPNAINLDEPPSFKGYHRLLAIDLRHTHHIGFGPPDDDGDVNLIPLMREIAKCQTLQGLNFYDNGVTDRDLEELRTMPNLKHLELSGNDRITDAGLVHLASIKSLRKLGLQGTGVTQQGVNELEAELPNCYIHWDGRDQANPPLLP